MAVIINASTSTGLVQSADTSGIIQFQSNGSTKATLNSSGFSYPGAVLQVVSATKTDTFTSSSYNTWVDVTGLSVSITPTSSSNKILVFASVVYSGTSASTGLALRCVRGSTPIGNGDAAGNRTLVFIGTEEIGTAGIYGMFGASFNNLDSPATTSSTTYKIQINHCDNYGTSVINRSGYDGDSIAFSRGSSSITVMEIAV